MLVAIELRCIFKCLLEGENSVIKIYKQENKLFYQHPRGAVDVLNIHQQDKGQSVAPVLNIVLVFKSCLNSSKNVKCL